jgi:hypothetical protein
LAGSAEYGLFREMAERFLREPNSLERQAHVPRDGTFPIGEAEQAVLDKRGGRIVEDISTGINKVYRVQFDDGSSWVYKPVIGEGVALARPGIPLGGLARREIAAYRLNRMIGFDRVPRTAMWYGPHGWGSLQEFVENARVAGSHELTQVERDEMAALDYGIANSDRKAEDYIGKAIDNGSSIPESGAGTIKSIFVTQALNRPLDARVIAGIRATDLDQVAKMLHVSGLSKGTDGVLARVGEMQERGMITGEAWPGRIA